MATANTTSTRKRDGTCCERSRGSSLLEERLGLRARIHLLPAQPGELEVTCVDAQALSREAGFRPLVSLEEGLTRLVAWHRGDA
jgi:nucleoside-diphosphate-sugar epimerase